MALAPTLPPPLDAPASPSVAPRRWRGASDEFLVRAAALGNENAIGAIHDRYRAPLERYCRTILLHRADAEDAAQAALAAGLRALSDGRARPHALRAWLYAIAHREALAILRRRPPAAAGEDALALVVNPREERIASRERLGELLDGLRALPERQRGALVLHEVAGLSFAEVGETLEISPAAARQAAYEARTELRTRREELQALFPAGPALALAAGGGAALAGGAAATGGAGALGALGTWLTGAGVASKCAAVCVAIGALGAGSLTVTHPPGSSAARGAETDGDRAVATADRPASPTADVARPSPVTAAAATSHGAVGPGRTERREAVGAETRPDRDQARSSRPVPTRAAVPAAQRAAPDVTAVTVEESPTGGQVPDGTRDATPSSGPAPDARATDPAPASDPVQDVTVEASSVGGGAVTGSPSDDVVSVQVE